MDTDSYVQAVVAEAPPLTAQQRHLIAAILGEKQPYSTVPRPGDIERQRAAELRARALADARLLSQRILACDVCDGPPEAHTARTHAWEPGRAERLTASSTTPSIDVTSQAIIRSV